MHFVSVFRIETAPGLEFHGFGGHLEQKHSRKQKLKSDIAFRNWKKKCEKRVLPKAPKNVIFLKNVTKRGIICIYQLLSTKYWNAKLNILRLDKNTDIQSECDRQYSATLSYHTLVTALLLSSEHSLCCQFASVVWVPKSDWHIPNVVLPKALCRLTNISSSRYIKDLLIMCIILANLFTFSALCLLKLSSQSMITPMSFFIINNF